MTDYRKRLEAELPRAIAVKPQATTGGPPVNYCHVRQDDLRKLLSEGERMRKALRLLANCPWKERQQDGTWVPIADIARQALGDPDQ